MQLHVDGCLLLPLFRHDDVRGHPRFNPQVIAYVGSECSSAPIYEGSIELVNCFSEGSGALEMDKAHEYRTNMRFTAPFPQLKL